VKRAGAQLPLFAELPPKPDGLAYWPSVVTVEEERRLVENIGDLPFAPFQFGAFQGNRRAVSYGYSYDYTLQSLRPAVNWPGWADPLIARVESTAQLAAGEVRQLLITEYAPGAGIGWHRDKPHFDTVLGLSLGSACGIRFRRKTGSRWQRFTLEAEARSLYMMRGEARHVWEHSFAPVSVLRYSITFRTMAGHRQ
jgi:alkylated DNA repair dioxygenase AlkB